MSGLERYPLAAMERQNHNGGEEAQASLLRPIRHYCVYTCCRAVSTCLEQKSDVI
jgi:hypothetical protein